MAKVGQIVDYNTVDGKRAAIVAGHGKNGDDDTVVYVFSMPGDESNGTGLTGEVNRRWTHEDHQAGGFSV